MPHDKNGDLLEVGDHVMFLGKVESISEGSETCNLSLKSVVPAKEGHYDGMTATAYLTQKISPGAIVDGIQLFQDIQALVASPAGQAVIADIGKLISDFKATKS